MRFKKFLQERFKSKDEDKIRLIASQVRRKLLLQSAKREADWRKKRAEIVVDPERYTSYERQAHRFGMCGDCGWMSGALEPVLQKSYPSAEAVYGEYRGKSHAWVEVPEVGLFVDLSFDQFKQGPFRISHINKGSQLAPTIRGRFPNILVKVGKMDSAYTKDYHRIGQRIGQGIVTVNKPQNLLSLLGDD